MLPSTWESIISRALGNHGVLVVKRLDRGQWVASCSGTGWTESASAPSANAELLELASMLVGRMP